MDQKRIKRLMKPFRIEKRVFFVLASIWLSINYTSYAQEDPNLKKAAVLLNEHKTREATLVLNQAIKADPANTKAMHLLGQIYLEERNYKLASLFLKQAIDKSPEPESSYYFDLGQALQLSHRFADAREQFELALSKIKDPGKSKEKKLEFIRQKSLITSRMAECGRGAELVADPLEVRITNLGAQINTASSEYHPMVTADNLQLFFTSREGEFDGKGKEEILQSFNKGIWEKSKPISSPISSEKGESCAGISPDGRTLYITRNVNGGDIFTSDFEDGEWSKPKAFPYNSPKYDGSVHISSDGKKLLFVSNRLKSKDIYVCTRSGTAWSKPVRLGAGINTTEDEESPWLDADGKFLYFSSNGHGTIGGFDIFKAAMEKNDALGEVQNLGYPINSASDDLYFMLLTDGKSAYYSSEKDGGFGKQDIYNIQMSIVKSGQLLLFKGTISELTGQPVDAQVLVTDIETGILVAKLKAHPQTGTFLTMLAVGRRYSVLAEKEGFLFYSDIVDLQTSEKPGDLNRDIRMQKLQPGVTIVLNNIFFDPGKSSLKKESSQELQRIVQIMRQNPNIRAEIGSYIEGQSSEEANLKLSENRAQAIVDYLVVTGIKATRLLAKGYGSPDTAPDTKPDRSKRQNKRTEFKILNVM